MSRGSNYEAAENRVALKISLPAFRVFQTMENFNETALHFSSALCIQTNSLPVVLGETISKNETLDNRLRIAK